MTKMFLLFRQILTILKKACRYLVFKMLRYDVYFKYYFFVIIITVQFYSISCFGQKTAKETCGRRVKLPLAFLCSKESSTPCGGVTLNLFTQGFPMAFIKKAFRHKKHHVCYESFYTVIIFVIAFAMQ